jgi:hypothetical protein
MALKAHQGHAEQERHMRFTIGLMICVQLAWFVGASIGWSQCSRAGTSSTAAGALSPITSTAGFSSPLATFNPVLNPASAVAAQYQLRLAQQQYMLNQQQRLIHALQASANQSLDGLSRESTAGLPGPSPLPPDAGSTAAARRARLRQQNAEKLLQRAEQAESDGRRGLAEGYYRRVQRIMPETDPLNQRASDAIARLVERPNESKRAALIAVNR